MTTERAREITKERFEEWTEHMAAVAATPALAIGVGHDGPNKGKLLLCSVNGEVLGNAELIRILKAVIQELR